MGGENANIKHKKIANYSLISKEIYTNIKLYTYIKCIQQFFNYTTL